MKEIRNESLSDNALMAYKKIFLRKIKDFNCFGRVQKHFMNLNYSFETYIKVWKGKELFMDYTGMLSTIWTPISKAVSPAKASIILICMVADERMRKIYFGDKEPDKALQTEYTMMVNRLICDELSYLCGLDGANDIKRVDLKTLTNFYDFIETFCLENSIEDTRMHFYIGKLKKIKNGKRKQ